MQEEVQKTSVGDLGPVRSQSNGPVTKSNSGKSPSVSGSTPKSVERKKSQPRKRIFEEQEEEKITKKKKIDLVTFSEDEDNEQRIVNLELVGEYNKNLKTKVEINMVGKFLFPVPLVIPARGKMIVREVSYEFVDILEDQMRTKVSGQYFRNALQINIYPHPSNTVKDKKKVEYYERFLKEIMQINNQNIKVRDSSATALSTEKFNSLLVDTDFKKLFQFEAIGGNHTREAFQRIIEDPDSANLYGTKIFDSATNSTIPYCLESFVYYNLGMIYFIFQYTFFDSKFRSR